MIARGPDAHTHRLLHRHAALASPPRLPRPRADDEAARPDGHAALCTRRPDWSARDHSGELQNSCCCCCCHRGSWEAAALRGRGSLRAGASATHARCDARCARSRARSAHDRRLLLATHRPTPHCSCCMIGHTAAAQGARASTSWQGMLLAQLKRGGMRVPPDARSAAKKKDPKDIRNYRPISLRGL